MTLLGLVRWYKLNERFESIATLVISWGAKLANNAALNYFCLPAGNHCEAFRDAGIDGQLELNSSGCVDLI